MSTFFSPDSPKYIFSPDSPNYILSPESSNFRKWLDSEQHSADIFSLRLDDIEMTPTTVHGSSAAMMPEVRVDPLFSPLTVLSDEEMIISAEKDSKEEYKESSDWNKKNLVEPTSICKDSTDCTSSPQQPEDQPRAPGTSSPQQPEHQPRAPGFFDNLRNLSPNQKQKLSNDQTVWDIAHKPYQPSTTLQNKNKKNSIQKTSFVSTERRNDTDGTRKNSDSTNFTAILSSEETEISSEASLRLGQYSQSDSTDKANNRAFDKRNIIFNCIRKLSRSLVQDGNANEVEENQEINEKEGLRSYAEYLFNYIKEETPKTTMQMCFLLSEDCKLGNEICTIAKKNLKEIVEKTNMFENRINSILENPELILDELTLIQDYLKLCSQIMERETSKFEKDLDYASALQQSSKEDLMISPVLRENSQYILTNNHKRCLQALKKITVEYKDIRTFLTNCLENSEQRFNLLSVLDKKVREIKKEEAREQMEYLKRQNEEYFQKINMELQRQFNNLSASDQEVHESMKRETQELIDCLKIQDECFQDVNIQIEENKKEIEHDYCVFGKIMQLSRAYLQPEPIKNPKAKKPKDQDPDNMELGKLFKYASFLIHALFSPVFEHNHKMNNLKKQEMRSYLREVLKKWKENISFNEKFKKKLEENAEYLKILCQIATRCVSKNEIFKILLVEAGILNDDTKNIKDSLMEKIYQFLASTAQGKQTQNKNERPQKKIKKCVPYLYT